MSIQGESHIPVATPAVMPLDGQIAKADRAKGLQDKYTDLDIADSISLSGMEKLALGLLTATVLGSIVSGLLLGIHTYVKHTQVNEAVKELGKEHQKTSREKPMPTKAQFLQQVRMERTQMKISEALEKCKTARAKQAEIAGIKNGNKPDKFQKAVDAHRVFSNVNGLPYSVPFKESIDKMKEKQAQNKCTELDKELELYIQKKGKEIDKLKAELEKQKAKVK